MYPFAGTRKSSYTKQDTDSRSHVATYLYEGCSIRFTKYKHTSITVININHFCSKPKKNETVSSTCCEMAPMATWPCCDYHPLIFNVTY